MSAGVLPASAPIPAVRLVFLWHEALAIALLLGAMSLGKHSISLLIGLGLLLWSLRNCASVYQTLSLLVPLSTLSWQFSPDPAGFDSRLKWLIIFLASGSAVLHSLHAYLAARERRALGLPAWLLTFLLFLGMVAVLAVVYSRSTELSLFKLVTFAVGVVGLMAACSDPRLHIAYCLSWLFTLHVVVLAISLLLIPLGKGYLPGTHYLMGVFNQSQAMGLFLVPFTTLLLVKWFTTRSQLTRLELVTCLAGMAAIYLTHSRTAAMSVLASLGIILLLGLWRATPEHQLFRRRFLPAAIVLVLLVVVADSFTGGRLTESAMGFINKGGVQVQSVLASREDKFIEAYDAFRTHPLTGVGFGMNLGKESIEVKRDKFFGVPISAPVEAGVMYMALPAQIGLLGLVPFLFFFLAIAAPIARSSPLPILGLGLGGLMTNAGEYTFFAIGGMGLFLWTVFALAYRVSTDSEQAGDS